jgi:hypothetical protein
MSKATLKPMHFAIQAFAEKAGAKGFKKSDVLPLLGLNVDQGKHAMLAAREAGLIVQSGTGSASRYFLNKELAAQHSAPAAPTAKPKRNSFADTIVAVRQAIAAAGDEGISTSDLSKALGRDRKIVRSAIAIGQVGHSVRVSLSVLHFATSEQAKAYADAAQPQGRTKRPKKQPAAAAPQPTVLAPTAAALPAPVAIRIKALQGEARWGDDMKVIIAPPAPPRIRTDDAQRLFSAAKPGVYIQADTWAARAYQK